MRLKSSSTAPNDAKFMLAFGDSDGDNWIGFLEKEDSGELLMPDMSFFNVPDETTELLMFVTEEEQQVSNAVEVEYSCDDVARAAIERRDLQRRRLDALFCDSAKKTLDDFEATGQNFEPHALLNGRVLSGHPCAPLAQGSSVAAQSCACMQFMQRSLVNLLNEIWECERDLDDVHYRKAVQLRDAFMRKTMDLQCPIVGCQLGGFCSTRQTCETSSRHNLFRTSRGEFERCGLDYNTFETGSQDYGCCIQQCMVRPADGQPKLVGKCPTGSDPLAAEFSKKSLEDHVGESFTLSDGTICYPIGDGVNDEHNHDWSKGAYVRRNTYDGPCRPEEANHCCVAPVCGTGRGTVGACVGAAPNAKNNDFCAGNGRLSSVGADVCPTSNDAGFANIKPMCCQRDLYEHPAINRLSLNPQLQNSLKPDEQELFRGSKGQLAADAATAFISTLAVLSGIVLSIA